MHKAIRKADSIVLAAALWLMATPAYAGITAPVVPTSGWSMDTLVTKLSPIVNAIFPVILFVAVLRIMWAGVQLATGQMTDAEAKGDKGPKAVLFNTVKGVLWIVGAWILVNIAMQMAAKVFSAA